MIFRLEPAPKLATQLDAPKVSRCKKSGNDKLSFLSILTCPVLPYQYHQQMQGGSYQCCKVKPKNLRVKKKLGGLSVGTSRLVGSDLRRRIIPTACVSFQRGLPTEGSSDQPDWSQWQSSSSHKRNHSFEVPSPCRRLSAFFVREKDSEIFFWFHSRWGLVKMVTENDEDGDDKRTGVV